MAIGLSFPSVLGAAQHGAEWAWQQLFDDLAPAVNGYAISRGVRDHEDLVSEVFGELAERIRSFTGNEQGFRSWTFTIAHSRIVDHQRRQNRNPEVGIPDGLDIPGHDDPADLLEQVLDPVLAAALTRLTSDQRETLMLRIVAGLTLEETAEVTGRNVNAVKQIQFRALQTLRREISRKAVTK